MAHAEALVENDVFVENGVFLPMESVEEVKLFAEKIGTNQKFRELSIEYLKSNLARVFPNCPDSFITAAYCAMFSARLTFESHDTSVKCCWRTLFYCEMLDFLADLIPPGSKVTKRWPNDGPERFNKLTEEFLFSRFDVGRRIKSFRSACIAMFRRQQARGAAIEYPRRYSMFIGSNRGGGSLFRFQNIA